MAANRGKVCTRRCRGCFYGVTMTSGATTCDYILVEREMRGCPAGDKCARYKSRANASRIRNPVNPAIFHDPRGAKEATE